MAEISVGSRVKLLTSIWDDGEDHHPPGWLAQAGEELIVRRLSAPGAAGGIAVSHENVEDSSFRIFSGEFRVIDRIGKNRMAKFKKENFKEDNKAGAALSIDLDICVGADGWFYSNIPDYLCDAFAHGQRDHTRSAAGCFKITAETYDELIGCIRKGLRAHLEPEITETPVILYNIESHVTFAEDDQGNIWPNAGFPGAHWPSGKDHQSRFGDHHATKPARGGFSLIIGARARLKKTIKYGDKEKVEYGNYYKGESHRTSSGRRRRRSRLQRLVGQRGLI